MEDALKLQEEWRQDLAVRIINQLAAQWKA
jgi:hypothetical protein